MGLLLVLHSSNITGGVRLFDVSPLEILLGFSELFVAVVMTGLLHLALYYWMLPGTGRNTISWHNCYMLLFLQFLVLF